jgi:hypothetical protein
VAIVRIRRPAPAVASRRLPVGRAPGRQRPGAPPRLPPHPKSALVSETGLVIELPFAPKIEHGNWAGRHVQQERTGRKPLLKRSAPSLRTISCELLLARPDHQQPVEDLLSALRHLEDSKERVRFRSLGPSEAGWWRITEMSVTDELRQHGSNYLTRVRASLTLTEASDAPASLIPPPSGPPAVTTPPSPQPEPAEVPGPNTYTVRSGDTLWALSIRFYGTGTRWTEIADANGVRDPRKLQIGTVLRIP